LLQQAMKSSAGDEGRSFPAFDEQSDAAGEAAGEAAGSFGAFGGDEDAVHAPMPGTGPPLVAGAPGEGGRRGGGSGCRLGGRHRAARCGLPPPPSANALQERRPWWPRQRCGGRRSSARRRDERRGLGSQRCGGRLGDGAAALVPRTMPAQGAGAGRGPGSGGRELWLSSRASSRCGGDASWGWRSS
jgi:hypothetical protein